MLRKSSELLREFIEYEKKVLAELPDMPHMPTLGDAYEEITKTMLEKDYVLPPEFDLHVVSGFITVNGKLLPQQIDCMLVVGKGVRYGRTDKYLCEIDQVLCVFEVKKTLNKADLSDAMEHLAAIRRAHTDNFERKVEEGFLPKIDNASKHFSQLTGRETIVNYEQINSLPPEDGILLYSLVQEILAPVTIIHGYAGYKKESGLRGAFGDILQEKFDSGDNSFGVLSLPNIVTSNEFSLVKTGGLPFIVPNKNSEWVSIISTRFNPLEIILEVVWSKISSHFEVAMPWDDDVYMNNISPFMLAIPKAQGEQVGWKYETIDWNEKKLLRSDDNTWSPDFLNPAQMSIMRLISAYGELEINFENEKYFEERYGVELKTEIAALISTRIFMMSRDSIKPINQHTLLLDGEDGTGYVASDRDRFDSWCSINDIEPHYTHMVIY
ncbi:DUF6602 domain-containing protein [Pantoea rwandensis]|uniref:DUF6602 domain-containing protein n=1 Tax=Pantoea rwandensis TaxID=1076550 RepID=A0ABM5RJ35_9GAMM|nr:DUF6602 domain-containing protein [Pantoea rwandensis]AIR86019.1 hypothetical protein LH22_11310 [Pantoea rwandensis]